MTRLTPPAIAAVLLAVLASACEAEDPGAGPPDASPPVDAAAAPDAPISVPDGAISMPDLSCLGQSGPSTALDPLVLAGKVFAVVDLQIEGIEGARVELLRRSDDRPLAEATTSAGGEFSFEVASGGLPVDAYFLVSTDEHLPTRAFPASPLAGGELPLFVVAEAAEVATWYAAAGDAFEGEDRTLITAIADCGLDAMDGSTVTIAPPTRGVTYWNTSLPGWDPGLAASTNGFALATGAAATLAAIASADGVELPLRAITSRPGELTLAVIDPHSSAD
jgi:hypothetical protein